MLDISVILGRKRYAIGRANPYAHVADGFITYVCNMSLSCCLYRGLVLDNTFYSGRRTKT